MRERSGRWSKLVLVILCGLVPLGIGAAAGVSVAEEKDAFCALCHVNPERTYVERAQRVAQAYAVTRGEGVAGEELRLAGRDAARDLASAHRAAALNCVACHRGANDLGDRATALALGARNTLFYLAGQFDPDHSGVAQTDLVEASCLRCHVDQPRLGGVAQGDDNPVVIDSFENHFHAYLFDPAYADQTTIGCLNCHPAHLELPPIVPYFIDEERAVVPTCVQCHIDVEKGPLDL